MNENTTLSNDYLKNIATQKFAGTNNTFIKIASSGGCSPSTTIWNNSIPSDLAGDCQITIYVEYTYNSIGCLTTVEFTYMGHTCPAECTTCGSGSESGEESGSSSGSNEDEPDYGGAPSENPLPPVDFCENLNQTQKEGMINTFTNLLNDNCSTNLIVKKLKQTPGLILKMCIDSVRVASNAHYNTTNKEILFKTEFVSTFMDVFREEIFHAYQDNVGYTNGIGSYGVSTGRANIEFEYKVFRDIMNGYPSALNASPNLTIKDNYKDWIETITNFGSTYPNISSITDFNIKFHSFLNEHTNTDPTVQGFIVNSSLNPATLHHIFNGLVKNNCGM